MTWAVIRVRGEVNVKPKIRDTMRLLRLNRVNHCVMVPEDATHLGMLRQVKDYVTWGEADAATAELLLDDAGMLAWRKPLDKAALKEGGFTTVKAFAKKVAAGKARLRDVPGLKPVLRLHPPRKGWEGVKRAFSEGGALGYRGDAINTLLRRMTRGDA